MRRCPKGIVAAVVRRISCSGLLLQGFFCLCRHFRRRITSNPPLPNDIFQLVRNGLSANGSLYAVPLYSETSFTFYRTDVFKAAGVQAPTDQITYTEFAVIVSKVHDPDNGIYGTCQRGKAGWGENMAFIGPLGNAFGARWFDEEWQHHYSINC